MHPEDDYVHLDEQFFIGCNMTPKRVTSDKHRVNNYGQRLIQLCKVNKLLILNGRTGRDKTIGRNTCNNRSVVDYVLADYCVVKQIEDFEVQDFDPLLSDVHSALLVTMKGCANIQCEQDENDNEQTTYHRWTPDKSDVFVQDIDLDRVKALIEQMEAGETNCVNQVTEEIGNMFVETASKVFVKKNRSTQKRREQNHGLIRTVQTNVNGTSTQSANIKILERKEIESK